MGCPILIWLATPFLLFMTEYGSVAVILCIVSIVAYLLSSVSFALRGRLRQALHFVLPVLVSVPLSLLLGKAEVYGHLGFWAHRVAVGDYLTKCVTKDFVSSGFNHRVGFCEITHQWATDDVRYIIYDTSGEIEKPALQRDFEWRSSVQRLYDGQMLVSSNLPTQNLGGSYYAVAVTIDDVIPYR
jgi:hypothetical protein